MQIWLNEVSIEINEDDTLEAVLAAQVKPGSTFALALNQVFIPKHQHATTLLQPGDRLDLVTPMQGG